MNADINDESKAPIFAAERLSLRAANKALITEDYVLAAKLYNAFIKQYPLFAKAVSVNLALANARIAQKPLAESLYRTRLLHHLTDVSKTNGKLNITAFFVISAGDAVERVTLQVMLLQQLVCRVIVVGLFTNNEGLLSFSKSSDVDFAILPVDFSDAASGSRQFKQLLRIVTPELLFADGHAAKTLFTEQAFFPQSQLPFLVNSEEYAFAVIDATTVKQLRSKLINGLTKSAIATGNNWLGLLLPNKTQFLPFKSVDIEKTATNKTGRVIVLFWKQNDTGLYGRRHDMVINYLAERSDISKILVIDAPIAAADLTAKQYGHHLTQDRAIYLKTFEKLLGQQDSAKVYFTTFVHNTSTYLDAITTNGSDLTFESYSTFLQSFFKLHSIDPSKAIFWFYPKNFLASKLIDFYRPAKVVVDVVDDHRAWPGMALEEKEKLTAHYKSILSKADMAFANCQPVLDSMRQFFPEIALVPNGCELNPKFERPLDNELYEELINFDGPVIGFVGNLESKIDIVLLEKIAKRFPHALLVLVGSTHANPAVRTLSAFNNVRMPGVIAYRYINAVVATFTVAIIPHLYTDLTLNMNPLKAFVYLANAKPVVATNVPNLASCDAVWVAENHSTFIIKLDEIIHHSNFSALAEAAKSFVKANSWQARFSSYVNKLLDA